MDIFISPWVRRRELRAFADQIDSAIAGGWLFEVTPSRSVVDDLVERTALDQGEAETIVAAGELRRRNMQLLIDEGRAFRWIQRYQRWPPVFEVVCLGQVLHQIEDAGGIESSADLMQQLLDTRKNRWAPNVREHYEAWCRQRSIPLVPGNPRT